MKLLLVATQEKVAFEQIKNAVSSEYEVTLTSNIESCLMLFQKRRPEYTFIDVSFLSQDLKEKKHSSEEYRAFLQSFWSIYPQLPLIVLSDQKNLRNAVNAVKAGAYDYLTYPVDIEEVRLILEKTYEKIKIKSELKHHRKDFWHQETSVSTQTSSPKMQKVFDALQTVAPTLATVLLLGETGVGKGIVARLIHQQSNRKDQPFIHVHCGAIPDTLLESELFGHEKGAFTNAIQRKLGKFEIAKKGTIFLDEIGTMGHSAQIKLLQVLQDKVFHRIGGNEEISSDVRVIAASNSNLKQLCNEGKFRNDLYYRLNVFPLIIPALRERKTDIPILANTFLKKLNQLHLKNILDIHCDVIASFQEYKWPGNIRELENTMERAYIVEESDIIALNSIPNEISACNTPQTKLPVNVSLNLSKAREIAVESFEKQYLKELLAKYKGRINQTAQAAGITTRQLHRLLSKYKINKDDFKNIPAN